MKAERPEKAERTKSLSKSGSLLSRMNGLFELSVKPTGAYFFGEPKSYVPALETSDRGLIYTGAGRSRGFIWSCCFLFLLFPSPVSGWGTGLPGPVPGSKTGVRYSFI